MRKFIPAVLAAAALVLGAVMPSASAMAATGPTGLCGALPVYRASGHESMVAWAHRHHAYVSTIILSTMAYCVSSGKPVVLRIVRQMDQYVNKGNQHLDMTRGMIFTSPPQAQG